MTHPGGNAVETWKEGARLARAVALALVLGGTGCAVRVVQPSPQLAPGKWLLLPVTNLAETPRAGERVESILAALWRVRGLSPIESWPGEGVDPGELDDRARYARALGWAREHGFQYGVTGSVEEWRYRSGLDGEPAVSVSLAIVEVASGRVVWSASGARSGWGRDTVSGVAHGLLQDLISGLRVE